MNIKKYITVLLPFFVVFSAVAQNFYTIPKVILPWGTEEPWQARYIFTDNRDNYSEPAADANGRPWTDLYYNDSRWQTLTGPMADYQERWEKIGFLWEGDNNCFNLRRTFHLNNVEEGKYQLLMHHDDGVRVYLNGLEVVNDEGAGYDFVYDIPQRALVTGENILTIYVEEYGGEQYLDYSLQYMEIVKVQQVVLNETSIELEGGKRFTLQATVLPEEAEEKGVTWSVEDESIATVSKNGVVRALRKGTTTVFATSVSNPDIKALCTVNVTSDYNNLNGHLPDVPFEFFYRAVDYDETTHCIPNHPDAKLSDYVLQLTADIPDFDGEKLSIDNPCEGYISKWEQFSYESGSYFFRQGQDDMTIIAKVKPRIDAGSCDFISNRAEDYNYMFRIGDNSSFYLHTSDAYDTSRSLVLSTEEEQILAVRVNGAEDYILLDNLTTGEKLRFDGVNWGGGGNSFNFFNNCGAEHFYGSFFWAYYSFEFLQDDEMEAVVAAADGNVNTEYTDKQGLVYHLDRSNNTATVIGHLPSVSESLMIPETVSRCRLVGFADGALADVYDISSVTVAMTLPYAIPENAFSTVVYEQATLFVPSEAVDNYRNTRGWRRFRKIDYHRNIILPWGEDEPWDMKYIFTESIENYTEPSTDSNGKSWTELGYDDSLWETLTGPMGKDVYYASYNYEWLGEYNCFDLRRTFTMESIPEKDLVFKIQHDDGVTVYVNGNLVVQESYSTDERVSTFTISREHFVVGQNILAIHIEQGCCPAFLDYTLRREEETPVSGICLGQSKVSIGAGEKFTLTVKGSPKDVAVPAIRWRVDDQSIASVDENGVVTGLRMGTTTVTATLEENPSVQAQGTVTVNSTKILPWGTEEPWQARYIFTDNRDYYSEPAADANGRPWTDLYYNDSRWQTLTGPMADYQERWGKIGFLWEGDYNCFNLRRTFHLDAVEEGKYQLLMHHDDGVRVYLNGQEVVDDSGAGYDFVYDIPLRALVPGENILAIYVEETGGEQYLDYCLRYTETVKVQQVVLNETSIELEGGKLFTLQATVLPEEAEEKGVTWSVEDESVATVSENGVVRALRKGTTTVFATSVANPDIKALCTVNVNSDYVLPEGVILPWGEDFAWEAKYVFANNRDNYSEPEADANGRPWTDLYYNDSGWQTLTGPIANSTEILNVVNYHWPDEIEGLHLRRTFRMDKFPEAKYQLLMKHDDGVKVYLNKQLVVENDNCGTDFVYDIPQKAFVTGENILAIYIDQYGGNNYLDYSLQYTEAVKVQQVVLNETSIELEGGKLFTLQATVLPEEAEEKGVTWSVEDESIATVSENGVVRALRKGTTTVFATSVANPDIKAICTVNVNSDYVLPEGVILPWGSEWAWTSKYIFTDERDSYVEPTPDNNGYNWTELNYDDSGWLNLTGPMADYLERWDFVGYLWKGDNNCFNLRRTFHLNNVEEGKYQLLMHHDNGVRVYLNGLEVVNDEGAGYDFVYDIPRRALVPGENILAIYAEENDGEQYLDYCLQFEPYKTATEITLDVTELTLEGGEFGRLSATMQPSEAHDKMVWSAADPTIVKVNQNGTVTGLHSGTTIVKVTASGNSNCSAQCTVTVTSDFNLIVPWGTDEPWEAKYRYWDSTDSYQEPETDAFGLTWTEKEYDDSAWQTLNGPLANNMERVNYQYYWEQDYSCFTLRRLIHLDRKPEGPVIFCMKHDDDTRVYMNGKLVIDAPDYTYDEIAHYTLPNNVLDEGDNMLAIYVQDTYGGWKFLDYAIGYGIHSDPDPNETEVGDKSIETPIGEIWYSLNGQRLQVRPIVKGIYIRNGQKAIVK